MANELKRIIREAFTIAYNNHKSNIISEDVKSLESKMSSGDVYKVENAFREIVANPNLALQYAWSPQGSENKKLNPQQFNLLAEMIFERTDLNTKRNLMMSLYGQNNQALFNKAAKRIMSTLNTPTNKQTMEQAYMEGWAQMFLDTEKKGGEVEIKQNFEDIVTQYSAIPANKRTNFGAYIAEVLTSNMLNAYKSEMTRERGVSSLDKPSTVTGKATEFGSEEDFGSDTLNPIMDPGSDLAGLGAGLSNAEDNDIEGSDEYLSAAGDEPEVGDEENVSTDQTVGADIEAGSPEAWKGGHQQADKARNNARLMIKRLEKSLYQAIDEFRKYEEPTPAQEQGLIALELILTGIQPKEATAKLGYNVTTRIQNLPVKFTELVDDYLLRNGFVNSRGKVDSFRNMMPQWIADAIKFKRTGELPKDFQDDRRTTSYSSGETEEEPIRMNMKQMAQLVMDTKKATRLAKQSGNDSKAISAVESLLSGSAPETVAKNFGYESIESLAQDIVSLNIKATPQDIADSAKSLKLGIPTKAEPIYIEPEEEPIGEPNGMNENRTFWFLEELMLENFTRKHLDKIMENVYHRLLPRLNK